MTKVEPIQYQVHLLAEEIKRLNVDLSSAKANFIVAQDSLTEKDERIQELEERLKAYESEGEINE